MQAARAVARRGAVRRSRAQRVAAAPKKKEKTIGELAARPVVVQPDQKVEASAARAMDNYRRFLELQKTDPQLRAEALRRLGDLNMEAGEGERMAGRSVDHRHAGRRGDQALHEPAQGLSRLPAQRPGALPARARLRDHRPAGEGAEPRSTTSCASIRSSPQMDEVQFRRGELLFSAQAITAGAGRLQSWSRKGDKSAFLTQSLYKHGWSLFKQGLNDESLPSFAGVLDRTMLHEDGAQARSRSTSCRAPTASWPTTRCASWRSRSRTTTTRSRAIDKFLVRRTTTPRTRPSSIRASAICTSRRSASRTRPPCIAPSPRASRTASSRRASRCRPSRPIARAASPQLVLEGKREYVALYNYGTTFWQGRNKADYPNIAKELKINLKDVATYFHAEAQKSKKADEYLEAARWYRTYLESFPDDPESFGTNYLLAETLYRGAGLPGRGRGIHASTAYNYPRNPRSAAAAYAALGSLHEARREAAGRREGGVAQAGRRCRREVRHQLPRASRTAAGVLTRAAEDIFATKDLQRSIEVANLVLAHQPPADQPKRRIAYTIIGQSNFDLLQFAEAEKGYIAARDLLPPNDKMRADLTERIASAVYRQAEAKQKAGDSLGAVDDFLRIAHGRGHLEDRRAGRIRRGRAAHHPQGMAARHPGARALPHRTTRRANSPPTSRASSRWRTARPARRARRRWNSSASR